MHHAMPEARRHRPLDLLAVGELLVDCISTEPTGTLADARTFTRHQGGSPANLARTLALLGNRAALVACVGDDGLGRFLRRELAASGVEVQHVASAPDAPTSLVLLARSATTADFAAYRSADTLLRPEHVPDELLERTTFYHTTCFALSREPARGTILEAAARAADAGCRLSLDANYAPPIWPDREEARSIVAAYCAHGAFVKLSEDDVARLFGRTDVEPAEATARFHEWGAALVCLTLGGAGSLVSWEEGAQQAHVAAEPVGEIADATGAGDTFWAGFLTAWLDGHPPRACARAGSRLAARKLRHVGPFTEPLQHALLYADER